MPGHDRNSEWERRMRELRTDQGLVGESLRNPAKFKYLMRPYLNAVEAYLTGFLLRHKLAPDETAAREAAKRIWSELNRELPGRLAEEWGRGKKRFRDLLREGVHIACHRWSKPATRALIAPGPDDDREWKDQMRRELLGRALEKLKAYQREHEGKGNLYYVIFRLWDGHRDESLDEINDRLAALPGGRRLDPAAFRKALGRARDQFGKYLFEEVAAWIAERDAAGPESYRQAFEEMDFMDDYALKSKSCRWLLGLDDEDD